MDAHDATTVDAEEAPARAPSFPTRFAQVFVAPERLGAALAAEPRWGVALLVSLAIVVLSTAVIPADVWEAMIREQMMARGQPVPENVPGGWAVRLGSVIGGGVFWVFYTFLSAGIVTTVFAFLLGDEGRFKQYLAVVAHAMIIPAVGALVVTPLKLVQSDPQVTLNLSLFAIGLDPDGYPFRVMRMLDLFGLWAWVVVAVGVHQIDRRRSVGVASAVLLTFAVLVAMLFAAITPA